MANRQYSLTGSDAGRGRPLLTGLFIAAGLTIAGTAASIVGCEDYRVPLATYLNEQELAKIPLGPDGTPATQPAAPRLEPWSPGPYKVGSGDVIGIAISGMDKLGLPPTQQARVTERGQVVLPMVGAVQVGGMTLDEAEAQIKAQYVPKFLKDTDVTTQVVEYQPIGVMVMGDVLRLSGGAQVVELRRDKASVLQAVLQSGGAQDYGGRVTVIPAKDPEHPTEYNLNDRIDLVRAARVGSIEESDLVIVDARPNDAIYIQGLVNAPGPIPLPRHARLTILQAIAAAGGTMLAFEPREATLMRHGPEGELVSVKIDLDRVKQGKDPDMALAAGDVLILPHNASTRVEEYIAKSLQFRVGTGIETTYNPWTLYYLRQGQQTNSNLYYDAFRTGIVQPFQNIFNTQLNPAAP